MLPSRNPWFSNSVRRTNSLSTFATSRASNVCPFIWHVTAHGSGRQIRDRESDPNTQQEHHIVAMGKLHGPRARHLGQYSMQQPLVDGCCRIDRGHRSSNPRLRCAFHRFPPRSRDAAHARCAREPTQPQAVAVSETCATTIKRSRDHAMPRRKVMSQLPLQPSLDFCCLCLKGEHEPSSLRDSLR